MKIDVHVYLHGADELLDQLNQMEMRMSKQLDDLKAAVAVESSQVQSAVTLLNGLSAMILSLKDDPAALEQLSADVKSQSDALAAAVVANTPVAP